MKFRLSLGFIFLILVITVLLPVYATAQQTSFQLERVVEGLEHPWAMAFLPSGDILISERPGRMQRLSGGKLTEVRGLPDIYSTGQGGLLDIAVHPDFKDNRFIYFTYSASGIGGAGTALYCARLEEDHLRE